MGAHAATAPVLSCCPTLTKPAEKFPEEARPEALGIPVLDMALPAVGLPLNSGALPQ